MFKELALFFITVGVIMSIGLVCLNEVCKTWTPAPSVKQYMESADSVDDLRELSRY